MSDTRVKRRWATVNMAHRCDGGGFLHWIKAGERYLHVSGYGRTQRLCEQCVAEREEKRG